jgi:PAT family beta-lactamase induction signal transducer AmpG
VNYYLNLAHNFNIKNGFIKEPKADSDITKRSDLVGNIGIVKFYLSKQPDKDDEYVVNLNYMEGSSGIKVIEGKTLKFTADNWNKPAFAVFHLDPAVTKKYDAVFKAQVDKVPLAWVFTFSVTGILFVLFFIYHKIILPKPSADKPAGMNGQSSALKEFFRTFIRFFEKKKIVVAILFLLFYRFGEAQLLPMAKLFLIDSRNAGGLGLSLTEYGWVYGTVGIISLMIGGLLGGFLISRNGLKFWMWPMLLAINIPHALYVYLAYAQPSNIWIIGSCVAGEQLGYGFGFTAYMMYMIYVSDGEYKTSHYAITTGFMALGMMLPGMISGFIQEAIGYKFFFIWLLITIIPSIFIIKFLPLEQKFGKKKLSEY